VTGRAAATAISATPEPSPPWLHPYRGLIEAIGGLDEALEAGVVEPLGRLVPRFQGVPAFTRAGDGPPGMSYEHAVQRHGCVPTRANTHDLFNALVWLRFPALKRWINAAHAAVLDRDGIRPVRGPLRDALTLLDENGLVLAAPSPLAQALRRRDWQAAFVAHRAHWQAALPVVVGHALLDKLRSPRPAITAHAVLVPLPDRGAHDPAGAVVDALLAAHTLDSLADKPFVPLPVLGIPGWWPANEVAAFYDDTRVFRPPARFVGCPHGRRVDPPG
jgi:hypothetical protein